MLHVDLQSHLVWSPVWWAVMLMGALIYRVHYTIPEYVCTLLVAGGVSVFALFKVPSQTQPSNCHPSWSPVSVSSPQRLPTNAESVSWFWLQGSSKATLKLAHPNAPLGYALCFLNLGMDGFTNATQDSISKR